MTSSLGGAAPTIPLENGARVTRTATGATVSVTHKTVPIEVSVRTPWGAVNVPPITFAVMPGSDDVGLFGMATMKALGLDLYPWALEEPRPSAVSVQTGVESQSFLAARRVTLSIQSFQSKFADDAPADVAVERLVERGTDMFMDPMEERGARDRALEDSVQQAEQSGLSADGACRLRDILCRREDVFRGALRGDPPARVELMRVHLKPQAQVVKARPRRYDPVRTGWLASCIAALVAFGLIVWNLQVVCASPAMVVRKRDTCRLVSDYQPGNLQGEQTPKVMTDLLRGLDCKLSRRCLLLRRG